jgi:hypothetical protein
LRGDVSSGGPGPGDQSRLYGSSSEHGGWPGRERWRRRSVPAISPGCTEVVPNMGAGRVVSDGGGGRYRRSRAVPGPGCRPATRSRRGKGQSTPRARMPARCGRAAMCGPMTAPSWPSTPARSRASRPAAMSTPVPGMPPRSVSVVTAWLQTAWPELAARCWFCGAPRGHLCVTAGGRVAGGPYAYRSHADRGLRRFRPGDGHGRWPHCYPHGATLWARAGQP